MLTIALAVAVGALAAWLFARAGRGADDFFASFVLGLIVGGLTICAVGVAVAHVPDGRPRIETVISEERISAGAAIQLAGDGKLAYRVAGADGVDIVRVADLADLRVSESVAPEAAEAITFSSCPDCGWADAWAVLRQECRRVVELRIPAGAFPA